ncbi:ArsR/SmtB family transcription factor [Catelliglobosispora koreensis]|uniref:ArsR/SmtB family transcription factor n=1 Tax=Catelliglobosispora koreensis TaxID=129052 RepID=UPI0003609209|nr:metalloregulator ArsR/SmtB family transcription factor [Catelliglobosispora koreensis]
MGKADQQENGTRAARRALTVLDQPTGNPPLAERPVMDPARAIGIAALFKILGNDTRLRLLHVIAREGEVRVSDIAAQLGMTQQAVSNQLQRLADQRIIAARRDGNSVFYRIVDSCVPALLDLGWCLHEATSSKQH